METTELERKIQSAFENDSGLINLLAKGKASIFSQRAPSVNQYPILVFATISDVPSLHGDNSEMFHRVTIRTWAITDAKISKAERLSVESVDKAAGKNLLALGFMRRQTTPTIIAGEKMIISDYLINTKEE